MGDWCTIESDPAVFTELIRRFNVDGLQVEEVFDLSLMEALEPVYGLIFLFKWQPDPSPRQTLSDADSNVFFARQIITNACATQAILSILLNIPSGEVRLGPELSKFKEFCKFLPFDIRGESLAESTVIKNAHNSFARPEPFEVEASKTGEKDDAFHFIAYVPINGKIYELDGLQKGPIVLGNVENQNWLSSVRPHIVQRIEAYQKTEQRFNLMAIVKDRRKVLTDRIQSLVNEQHVAEGRLRVLAQHQGNQVTFQPTADNMPDDSAAIAAWLQASQAEIQTLAAEIQAEEVKRAVWAVENERRRFNYIPFVFELLKKLTAKGKLEELTSKAKEREEERRGRESSKGTNN